MTAALFAGLFDDAALFPPGDAAMPDAIRAHRTARSGFRAGTIGPFVCPAPRLAELDRELGAAGMDRFAIALTVPGGPAELPAALRAAPTARRVRLTGVEFPLCDASMRVALDTPVTAYAEVRVRAVTRDIAERLLDAGLRLKLRTGGTSAAAFPTEAELARALTVATEAGLAFKCTAGLHHAVRQRDPATGFAHHGFLNVMLAVHAARTGSDVEAALAEPDQAVVVAAISGLAQDDLAAIRRVFRSFGTCSTDEPLADLIALGLLR